MDNYKNCQSCGIPIKKATPGFGTNSDGTKSHMYCGFCFQNGEFTFKGNVQEMQEFCKNQMIKGGHSKFTAWLFSRGLSRLKRWKN